MQNRKKTERYLKNGIDILLLILSFLGSAFLAKSHAGSGSGFFGLAGWEIYFLLFLCLAWNMSWARCVKTSCCRFFWPWRSCLWSKPGLFPVFFCLPFAS
jgi:hypothetical protein